MALFYGLATARPHLTHSLVAAIDAAPIAHAPRYLLVSIGVMVCKIVAAGGITYYHLVVSDRATQGCEEDAEAVFREEGLQRWREAVIEAVHMPRRHPFFPGSSSSTLYVLHPEATS
ncbi:hypothetical protein ABT354_11310 [Streptomyces sp. NPDC000594]|uniref:hypothetical protein n=1 Tax=Streptomyces sp. NPDC000594 TaxID=3154261 RepID=UPI003319ECFB